MSEQVKSLVKSSWATSTQSSYNTQLRKWLIYCQNNNIAPYAASFDNGAEFLAQLYKSDARYSTVASARSMLSTILPMRQGTTFGKDELISRILKGIFRNRPSLPKRTVIYDTDKVLSYINSLPRNQELMLELLTQKLCTLLCILSGQRAQTIAALNLKILNIEDDAYIPSVKCPTDCGTAIASALVNVAMMFKDSLY